MAQESRFKIEARTPPSRRHPEGLPRCRRVITAEDGTRRQCSRTASWRLGSPVCGVHGGGWAIRVARGERRNPITASLVSARKASDRTLDIAFGAADLSDPSPVDRAVLGELLRRSLNQVGKAVRAYEQFFRSWYGVNGRTCGRPSKEDLKVKEELRRQFLFAPLARALEGSGGASSR